MRNKQKKRLILLVLLAAVVIIAAIAAAWIIQASQYRNVKFFYQDFQANKMSHETRTISLKDQSDQQFESGMIREYLLGPQNYELRLPLAEDVNLRTAWIARTGGIVTMFLDFNTAFSDFAAADNDACRWVIQGIIDTLQKNTRVQKLQILVDEQQLPLNVGTWNLLQPIPVKKQSFIKRK